MSVKVGKSYSQQQLAVLASSFPNLRISVDNRPPISPELEDSLKLLAKVQSEIPFKSVVC
jgi:hypothetical protein